MFNNNKPMFGLPTHGGNPMQSDFKNFLDTIKALEIEHSINWGATKEEWQQIILKCGYNLTALAILPVRVNGTDFVFAKSGEYLLSRNNETNAIQKRQGEQLRYAESVNEMVRESLLPSQDRKHAFPAISDFNEAKTDISKERDEALVKEMKEKHPDYRGWKFDYMFPGYFSYYSDLYRVFFTPDNNVAGEIDCQIQTSEGEQILVKDQPIFDVQYEKPLTVDQLFKAAQTMIDRIEQTDDCWKSMKR